MLIHNHLLRSAGSRTLFLLGAMASTAIVLWTYQIRVSGDTHGLSKIFFVLFAYNDCAGSECVLLIFLIAFLGFRYLLLVRPTPLRAVAAGGVGSLALVLHNPLPHILFAAPWLVSVMTRRGGKRLLFALTVGYLPLCTLLGLGWFLFSGHLLREGLASSTASVAAPQRLLNMLQVFSLPDPTVVLARLIGIAKIWVWAVPGLVILAIAGAIRQRSNMLCRLITASALFTLVGYFFVPVDQGHGWGYRYFHPAWLALPLLATGALLPLAGTPMEINSTKRLFQDDGTKSFVAACCLLSLMFGVGFRAWQLQSFIARNLEQVPQYRGNERRVEILNARFSFYGADLVQNDPWLRGNEIRMFTHGTAADEQMMTCYYPDFHKVYQDRYGTVWDRGSVPLPTKNVSESHGCKYDRMFR